MTRPLVTIGIPTYNRANAYLGEALTCAVSQTYPDIEIVVSDNCSTDHTGELVEGFQDSRIRYFKQETNIGANNNFNFCVNQAGGEYFLMLLDDDLVDTDFIETCINAVDNGSSPGIIRTGTRIVDAGGNVLFERPNTAAGLSMTDFMLAWFSNETTMYVCSTLFNTKGLKEIGGFQSRHALFQDVMAEIKLAAKYGRTDIHDVKAGFRKHGANMGSAAKVMDWCEDSQDLLNIICGLIPADEALLRRAGLPFFCRMNYGYARNIKSPVERFQTYLKIASFFDDGYSPYYYAYKHDLLPWLRAVKRRMRGKAAYQQR